MRCSVSVYRLCIDMESITQSPWTLTNGPGTSHILACGLWVYMESPWIVINVSRFGLALRRLAGKQKDLGSIRFGSPFSSLQKLWFMDTVS